jgi:phosphatidate phosphatase LPIN
MDSDERNENSNTSREMASAPLQEVSGFLVSKGFGLTFTFQVTVVPPAELKLDVKLTKEIPPAQSAPALPSTPIQIPVKDAILAQTPIPSEASTAKRKFAKTLRLTSEQLVCCRRCLSSDEPK